jgi:drug/metabolite transporter (DMT)-like permease
MIVTGPLAAASLPGFVLSRRLDSALDIYVFLAVMASAAMHAGWNALLKGGGDPFDSMARISAAGGLIAAIGVWFVQWPIPAAWPWIALSWGLHAFYRFFLISAYRAGDLSHVYPIARGSAPLLTAIGTAVLIGETLTFLGYAGVAALASGVFLMSMKGSRDGGFELRAVGFALATAITICGYTMVDGYGARINGSAVSFILWEMFGNAIIMAATALRVRGPAVYATLRTQWPSAIGAAGMSTTAYVIVTWAMTKAPIALVAALRETGVLFAALIGVIFLGEPMTCWRWTAAAVFVSGVVMLRLS